MEQAVKEGKAWTPTRVDTKTVRGRRELTFRSLAEVLADAEKLVASPHTRMLGNWPLSQLLTHLAAAINRSIDGISVKVPFLRRLLGRFLKGRVTHEEWTRFHLRHAELHLSFAVPG